VTAPGTAPGSPGVPAVIAAELAARPSWDEPPGLYLIGARDGRCELLPFAVPLAAWSRMPVHGVIAAVAAFTATRSAGSGPDPAVLGTAARFEAWDLPWPFLKGPALTQARLDLAAGRVRARTDRIEARYILATARDGTAWQGRQYRVQASPSVSTYPPGTPPPGDPISSALRLFTRAAAAPGIDGPAPSP